MRAYRVDGRSRPAYEPAMMVALLLYAYARGIRSSRVIERACEEDVAFRVIAAQQRPDHATIARFVERHQDAIAGLFGEVLALCARRGLAKVGVIAVDGTKVHGQRQPRREPRLRAARARDPRGGQGRRRGRGRALRRRARRRAAARAARPRRAGAAWLREAKRRLESERASERRSRCRAVAPEAPQGGQAPPGRGAVDRVPRQRGLRGLPGARADEGRPALRPRRPKPYTPPATPEGQINVTDPDSRVVKGLRGFIQGYNAQAVTNEHQIVLAAEVMTVGAGLRAPRADARRRPARARRPPASTRRPSVVLADAGYWHQRADGTHRRPRHPGADPARLQQPQGRRGRGWDGGLYAFMRRVLATERGGELYGQRQPIIEPVFGHTKFNRGMDRFHRRGRAAVRTEWRLITATHNLLKLHRHATAPLPA